MKLALLIVSRTVLIVLLTTALLLGVLLASFKLLGGQSYSVLSNSMSPAVKTGDMVSVLPIKGRDVKPGQIVAFSDPDLTGKLFQHRVQIVKRTGLNNTTVSVETRGDANTSSEKWMVKENDKVGKVVLVVPKVGFVVGKLTGGFKVELLNRDMPIGMLFVLFGLFTTSGIILFRLFFEREEPHDEGGAL